MTNANEYQGLAEQTMNPALSDKEKLLNCCLGLAGEVGEFVDAVKKHTFQGHELNTEHLSKELGDILWYVANAASALGVDMGSIMAQNIKKLSARYPNGFSSAASVNHKA